MGFEMDDFWQKIIWHQFGAAIDMMHNAIEGCPDELWTTPLWDDPTMGNNYSQFWYIAYHTLFWLDLYLTGTVDGFSAPPPYTLDELDAEGLLPERVYSRTELLQYLSHGRNKCKHILASLSEARANELCKFPWGEVRFAELLIDNMRHVQEHSAQLNMFLGQKKSITNRWIAKVS